MGQYRSSKMYKFSYILLILVIILAVFAFSFHRQVSKHMAEICEYKGRETATEIVSKAVDTQLANENGDYINVMRDSNDKITAIETNSETVNALQNDIKSAVNKSLSKIEDKDMSIPMGTLTGITFFSGRGSDVTLKLHQVGSVSTQIKSEFLSAGVNQTKHRMSVVVTVEVSAILPLHSTDIIVTDEYLISETIIVGEVPDVYLEN